jgi:hypothetical protein
MNPPRNPNARSEEPVEEVGRGSQAGSEHGLRNTARARAHGIDAWTPAAR